MAEEPKKIPGLDREAQRIRFDYIKGNYFRVIHVDGVFGGNAPRGFIHMAVWNERWPIPKQTTHELTTEGKAGKEILEERVFRDAIVREVEAQIVMDIPTAKKVTEWLQRKIDFAESTKEGTKK